MGLSDVGDDELVLGVHGRVGAWFMGAVKNSARQPSAPRIGNFLTGVGWIELRPQNISTAPQEPTTSMPQWRRRMRLNAKKYAAQRLRRCAAEGIGHEPGKKPTTYVCLIGP